MHWFLDPIKNKYADFSGRATRQEFWMYILVYLGVAIAVSIVAGVVNMPFLHMLFSLALLVPSIAITTRRLHDVNKSGWWQLIGLIPILGLIIMVVLLAGESKDEGNQYGPNPKDTSSQPETESAVAAQETSATPEVSSTPNQSEQNSQQNQ